MAGRPKKYHINLTDEEFKSIKSIIRKKSTSKTLRTRCQIILDLDENHGKMLSYEQCYKSNGVCHATVSNTVKGYATKGMDYLKGLNRNENSNNARRKVDGLDNFIFVNKEGKLLNFQNLNVALKNMRLACNEKTLREKSGGTIVPHFSCHVIRHTFCARLCEVETNIKVIQEIMGHADIRTTMEIYAEVSIGKKKQSIAEHCTNLMPA